MSSTINPAIHGAKTKRQLGKRYGHKREASAPQERLPRPRKRELLEPAQAKLEYEARRSERPRALCVFEEFEYNGVAERLRRRRDVYLKRWNLVALSERFSSGKLDGRATLILTIVTEEAPPPATSAEAPAANASAAP